MGGTTIWPHIIHIYRSRSRLSKGSCIALALTSMPSLKCGTGPGRPIQRKKLRQTRYVKRLGGWISRTRTAAVFQIGLRIELRAPAVDPRCRRATARSVPRASGRQFAVLVTFRQQALAFAGGLQGASGNSGARWAFPSIHDRSGKVVLRSCQASLEWSDRLSGSSWVASPRSSTAETGKWWTRRRGRLSGRYKNCCQRLSLAA